MKAAIALAGLAAAIVAAAGEPRIERAPASVPAPGALGGGVVLLEALVSEGGVSSVERLSGGTAFLDLLEADVSGWRFEPGAGPAPLLVVGVYRPPELLLTSPLALPQLRRKVTGSVPVPSEIRTPAYPPGARGDGAVVLEAAVDAEGAVSAVQTIEARDGFTEAARQALVGWRFRPALDAGAPVASRAVVVFVFRAPVVVVPPRC